MSEITTAIGKYHLSSDELRQAGIDLAEAVNTLEDKKRYKAEITKELAAEVVGIEGLIAKVSRIVRDGYDYREQECYVEKDHVAKLKRYVSVATGEILKTEPFNASDFQLRLADSVR